MQRYGQTGCQIGKCHNMNLKISTLALILSTLFLAVACKKTHSTSPSGPHPSITGEWKWQYTYGAWPDSFYAPQDSSVTITFTANDSFFLSLNSNESAAGTWKWQDTILVLTSSAALNYKDYAQSVFFNSTNPSEYFVQLAPTSLQLSKNFIIPGATTSYQTPIEPQIMAFTLLNVGSVNLGVPAN
jgi:hypothetical protein